MSVFVPPTRDETRVLIVPGLFGSSEGHWQSEWQRRHPDYQRVVQDDWHSPTRVEWLAALDRALCASDVPAVLVAHSLGCALVAHWIANAERPERRVRGALLVAPADVEQGPSPLRTFAPLPRLQTAIPLWIVASANDPYASASFSRALARHWGAELYEAGALGHINVDSGHGAWPEGEQLLHRLRAAAERSCQIQSNPI